MHCPRCKADCCQGHTFSLRSDRSNTYYKQNIQVSLCPKLDKDGKHAGHPFPSFNHDGKWYTPAFALEMDKNYTLQEEEQMLWEQQRKVREALENKPDILVPRPSHKNKYCSVCKSNYDDYLEHIRSSPHMKAIKKSKYNKHVEDLCTTLFKPTEVKSDREETTKEREGSEATPIRKKRKLETVPQQQEVRREAPQETIYSLMEMYRMKQMALMSLNGVGSMPSVNGFYPFMMAYQFPQPMSCSMAQNMGYSMLFPGGMYQQPLLIKQTTLDQ